MWLLWENITIVQSASTIQCETLVYDFTFLLNLFTDEKLWQSVCNIEAASSKVKGAVLNLYVTSVTKLN